MIGGAGEGEEEGGETVEVPQDLGADACGVGGCKDPRELRQAHAHESPFSTQGAPVLPAAVRQSCRQRHTSCADPDGADDQQWVSTLMKRLAEWMAQDEWEKGRRTSGERRNSCGSLQNPLSCQ